MQWRKSSYSNIQGNCVEVANQHKHVKVRDSQNRGIALLDYPAAEWAAFITAVRSGQLN